MSYLETCRKCGATFECENGERYCRWCEQKPPKGESARSSTRWEATHDRAGPPHNGYQGSPITYDPAPSMAQLADGLRRIETELGRLNASMSKLVEEWERARREGSVRDSG